MNQKTTKHNLTTAAMLIFPPLTVIAVMLAAFYSGGLFPFGKGSITWCDMSQQVIPLMCDLKDMLTGKSGIFLNLQNAGGMNMWGVIFFFVASPLNLSVLFVDKENFVFLVNILLIAKLALSAFTSAIYFWKCHKKLSPSFVWLLSVCYGLCGYGMIMYQNLIWLDVMYLFPLLVMSMHIIFEEKRIKPYVFTLTLMMIINYYIGYMIVVYILLFMGIFSLLYRKEEKYSQAGVKFVTGSFLSALLSAVVWLPSFAQYLSSGRDGLKNQLSDYDFFGNYQTTAPQLFCMAFIFALFIVCLIFGRKHSKRLNGCLLLGLLMIIPMYIEPVNLYWHMGSYMCFPGRYGFITIFSVIICGGMFLERVSQSEKLKKSTREISCVPALVVCWVGVVGICFWEKEFIKRNFEKITNYTHTLWQNNTSYHLLAEIFVIMLAAFIVIVLMYRKGWLKRTAFVLLSGVLIVCEGFSNAEIYVTSPYKIASHRTESYQKSMSLADKIEDNNFYRVKTNTSLFDVNLLGAMGYRSLSHYTSLTSKDYMYMAKLLGYSSYWMEVGCYGGTEISDALLGIKYRIENNTLGDNAVFSNSAYQIYKQDYALPLGIVTKNDLSDCESLEKLTRQQVQELIYDKLISSDGIPIVSNYQYDTTEGLEGVKVKKDKNGSTCISVTEQNGYIFYRINVFGRQSLYFDCFDKLSSDLNEDINGSFDVYVNGYTVQGGYPSQKSNGLMYLGSFENQLVNIKVKVNQNVTCRSFGVFGVNTNRLEQSVKNVKTAGLNENHGIITGKVTGEQGEKCVVSVPYSKSMRVYVNGKRAKVNKTFEDMVYFDLEEGENNIVITSVPLSFYAGLLISIVGIVLCVLYKFFKDKIKISEKFCGIVNSAIICTGFIVLIGIYLVPVIAKLVISI